MAPARKNWDDLSMETQARYIRAGVNTEGYATGAQMQVTRTRTRGQKAEPRPKRSLRKPTDGGGGRA